MNSRSSSSILFLLFVAITALNIAITLGLLWQWLFCATSPGDCPHQLYITHVELFAGIAVVAGIITGIIYLINKR